MADVVAAIALSHFYQARQQGEKRAELQRQRAEKLVTKLRELNVDPDSL